MKLTKEEAEFFRACLSSAYDEGQMPTPPAGIPEALEAAGVEWPSWIPRRWS